MNIAAIALDAILMGAATVPLMLLLGSLSRHLLRVRMSAPRVVFAGLVGLGAGVGFESRFVWRSSEYTPALIPVLIGIIFLVAIAVLVIAELLVPQGTLPRPDRWLPLARQGVDRQRRYLQLIRILARHRLFTIRMDHGRGGRRDEEIRRQARAVTAALEEAGGAFVKLGQLLSTRPDVLPAEFLEVLETLQQDVPPVSWAEVDAVLTRSFGRPSEEVFAEISHQPLAAASIGQVHLARLESGERVAVKIRRPGIAAMVERDMDIAERLAHRLAVSNEWAERFGIEQLVASLTQSLRDELDYTQEAANIRALTEAQEQVPEDARVRIPRFVESLSTEEVLVMEMLEGSTLSSAEAMRTLAPELRQRLSRRLLAATLAQIMEVGVFHSDLHPGNVIIDDEESLALLDFGSVGRIDSETRGRLGEVLFAFSRRDASAFTDALFTFVDLDEVQDELGLRREITGFMARRLGPGTTLDTSVFSDAIAILTDHGLRPPAELTVPFRTIATAEGSLRALDPDFDLGDEAGRYAKERLRDAARPSSVSEAVSEELMGALPIIKRLPHRVDRISGTIADGRFSMNVRLFSDARDRTFLREIISLGVVTFLAGVFAIMAAMLLANDTGPQLTETMSLFQIFGYLSLVVAGVLTLRALFDVLRRRPHRSR